jgi:four helix bundle protein
MIHKQMDMWKHSINLTIAVYRLTKKFPDEERFGLSQQMRRAAVSISSNIAEGAARKSKQEFIQFLYISLGSLSELETQLILSEKLDFAELSSTGILDNCHRIRQMIQGLIRYLNSK